jgi:hypothetical protein
LFAQWVIYFDWKKKFAGLGGVKGGSHEYILHLDRGVQSYFKKSRWWSVKQWISF